MSWRNHIKNIESHLKALIEHPQILTDPQLLRDYLQGRLNGTLPWGTLITQDLPNPHAMSGEFTPVFPGFRIGAPGLLNAYLLEEYLHASPITLTPRYAVSTWNPEHQSSLYRLRPDQLVHCGLAKEAELQIRGSSLTSIEGYVITPKGNGLVTLRRIRTPKRRAKPTFDVVTAT